MGVRIINADGCGDSQGAVFYCSTTMWAFGPVMKDYEEAEAFLKFLSEKSARDPRSYNDAHLEMLYSEFCKRSEFTDGSPVPDNEYDAGDARREPGLHAPAFDHD